MNLTLTLTASTLAAIGKVLDCKKSLLLEGRNDYIIQSHATACEYALYQLIYSNAETTGMNAMLAEVERIQADEDGEFAAQRERLAIEADAHNEKNKAHLAQLRQVLNAVKLEQKELAAQEFTA